MSRPTVLALGAGDDAVIAIYLTKEQAEGIAALLGPEDTGTKEIRRALALIEAREREERLAKEYE